jgi:hypothetical protein
MFGQYWIPKREDFVTDIEVNILESAFNNNKNIIIDATNLNPKTINKWKQYIEEWNEHVMRLTDNQNNDLGLHEYEYEFKFFNITPEEAIKRDAKRENPIGEEVIVNFWKRYVRGKKDKESYKRFYIRQDVTLPDAIIVDIDGTVALMNDRSPYDGSKVDTDLPNTPVIDLVIQQWTLGKKVLFMSGRSKGSEELTRKWIEENISELNGDYQLFMRESDDWRKDAIVKKELYEANVKDKYNVLFVLDDRDQTVKGWRDLGLLCLQVYYGDF